jgi:hypothetical protein
MCPVVEFVPLVLLKKAQNRPYDCGILFPIVIPANQFDLSLNNILWLKIQKSGVALVETRKVAKQPHRSKRPPTEALHPWIRNNNAQLPERAEKLLVETGSTCPR